MANAEGSNEKKFPVQNAICDSRNRLIDEVEAIRSDNSINGIQKIEQRLK